MYIYSLSYEIYFGKILAKHNDVTEFSLLDQKGESLMNSVRGILVILYPYALEA